MKSSQEPQFSGEGPPPVSSSHGVSSAFSTLSSFPWFKVRSRLEEAFTYSSWRSASRSRSGCYGTSREGVFLVEETPSRSAAALGCERSSEVSGLCVESDAPLSAAYSESAQDGMLRRLFDQTPRTVAVDEEGRYIPASCGFILLLSSLTILPINPYMAFSSGCDILGCMSLLICCCSVLHWVLPRWGWRRRVDVATARVVSVFFLVTALTSAPSHVAALYLAALCAVLAFNRWGWQFSCNGRHLEGTLCHLGLHAVGTAANAMLFRSIQLSS